MTIGNPLCLNLIKGISYSATLSNKSLMKNRIIPCLLAVVALGCSSNQSSDADDTHEESSLSIMAYYVPENPYDAATIPVEKLTHIIFSFSVIIDGEMAFRRPESQGQQLEQLVEQKSRNPELKVMIACGGWGADGFSDMSSTPENRAKFVASTIDFVEQYKLDGVDIDWEYPAIPAAGTGARPEDKQTFTLLMKELREALDKLDRPQTLTFASAGWKRYYDNVELVEVMEHVDYMNIMTYDQTGAARQYTSHNTALGWIKDADVQGTPMRDTIQAAADAGNERAASWEPQSAEKIIQFCIDKGVKPEQIVIGAAFYGRSWMGVPPENNGLYQMNGGRPATYSYTQIRNDMESNPDFTRYWDPVGKAAFLYNSVDSTWITFDDTVSVRLKTEYAMERNLGGIMFWQLGHDVDDESGLLSSIYRAKEGND